MNLFFRDTRSREHTYSVHLSQSILLLRTFNMETRGPMSVLIHPRPLPTATLFTSVGFVHAQRLSGHDTWNISLSRTAEKLPHDE